MNLTLQQELDIILEALEALGSYERCDCGCPNARQARIADKVIQIWDIARDALEKIDVEPKVYEYDETSGTYRQSSQQDSVQ